MMDATDQGNLGGGDICQLGRGDGGHLGRRPVVQKAVELHIHVGKLRGIQAGNGRRRQVADIGA